MYFICVSTKVSVIYLVFDSNGEVISTKVSYSESGMS